MDDKIWSFIVISAMWGGVLFYMVQLNKKASRLEKMLKESEDE